MNQIEIAEQLKDVPDQYLLQEVQQPTGNFPAYLVVSEMTRRKRMRQAAAQPAPTTTVVEDLAMGAQQPPMPPQMPQTAPQMPQQAPMGLGALPQAQGSLAAIDAGAAPEQRTVNMSGGGMVSFKQGGEVDKYQQGGFADAYQRYQDYLASGQDPLATSSAFQRFIAPISPSEASRYKAAKEQELARLAVLPLPGIFDVTTPAEREAYKQRTNLISRFGQGEFDPTKTSRSALAKEELLNNIRRSEEQFGPSAKPSAEKAVKQSAQVPAQNRGAGLQVPRAPASPANQMPYQAEFDKGIAAFLARQPMTEEQLMAARATGARQYEQEMPDRISPLMAQEIAAREGRLGKEKGSNLNMALMQAGLAMMGNRSQYGMQAVGQGGLEGLKAYREGKKDIEQGEAELTKARIAAAQAQALYDQGKYAAGDKALDRANDIEAKALAKQQSDLAVMASAQDRYMAQQKLPYELQNIQSETDYRRAMADYARRRPVAGGGDDEISGARMNAASAIADKAMLGHMDKIGTPEYVQMWNQYYQNALYGGQIGAAGPSALPTSGAAKFLGFE